MSSTLPRVTRAIIAAVLLAGCMGAGCIGHERFAGAQGEALYDEVPSIDDIRWDCSIDDATWTFEVDTVNWTANGKLWLATSADYVEQHAVRSVSAAYDGSWDQLSLELGIVADWRDASSGSSTAFLCDTATVESMGYRLAIYTPGSEELADCRSWGAVPTLFDSIDGVAACELLWDPPDTGTPN